jgi:signal transduction histidine kinase
MDVHRPFRDFCYSFIPPTGMSTHFRVSGSAVFNKSGLAIGYRSMPSDDGGRRHFSVSGVPAFDRNGKFSGYRGTSREVTKEILTERRAAAAHQRLLDAIEALPESFVLCDAEDRIVLCNSATYTRLPWCKTLLEPGMKYEDALREIALSGAAAGVRGREEEWVRENMERHRQGAGERLYRRTDGRWVQVSERKTADGGTVVIRADVTEEKQAEIQREAALTQVREENRAKSTFMANYSHELRAPVTQIVQLAQALLSSKSRTKLAPSQRRSVTAIEEAAEQTLRLVSDALDISRLQVGKYSLEPSDVDIADLISCCCTDVTANAGKSGRRIEMDIAPDVGSLHVDETAMRHLLLSIIGNAWGDNNGKSTIRVTALADGDQIEIGVLDPDGEVSEADLDILMRPFNEIDAPVSNAPTRNFGVGWAISGALAREIGAILSVATPEEGGTRIILTMPRGAPRG